MENLSILDVSDKLGYNWVSMTGKYAVQVTTNFIMYMETEVTSERIWYMI